MNYNILVVNHDDINTDALKNFLQNEIDTIVASSGVIISISQSITFNSTSGDYSILAVITYSN